MTWHAITGHAIGAHPRNGFGEGGGYLYRGRPALIAQNAALSAPPPTPATARRCRRCGYLMAKCAGHGRKAGRS